MSFPAWTDGPAPSDPGTAVENVAEPHDAYLSLILLDLPDPRLLSSREIGRLLTKAREFARWAEILEKQAELRLRSGKAVTGWKLVEKRAHRQWRDEDEAIRALEAAGLMREELFQLRRPPQIEKLLGTSRKALLESLVVAKSSATTIAPETDKRPAISATKPDHTPRPEAN